MLIKNVQKSYYVCLELVGVGYKASSQADQLLLKLGFSHDIQVKIPSSVRVVCLKSNRICCYGFNKHAVTQFAQQLRNFKPPEVYKGKGLRYRHEIVRLRSKSKTK